MGLDTLELVISIEQSFGIQIPNDVAARLETPGMIIDYIHSLQSPGSGHSACLTQRAFYRLRKACVDEGLCSRSEFLPDSDLNRIVPMAIRRDFWKKLVHQYQLNPAPLERPPAGVWTLFLMVLCTSGWIATHYSASIGEWIGLFLSTAILLGIASIWLSTPWMRYISENTATPASMVEYMTLNAPGRYTRNQEPLTRTQIAATVKALTLEFCNEKDYRENAHIVRDLGLD